MKVENLSLRQVGTGIPALVLAYWAALQFAILPNLSEDRRRHIYPSGSEVPYLLAVSLTFMIFGAWFVFRYQGRFATHGRKVAVFAMALGSLCGIILEFAIRAYWHI
jgi:hypothetical protein